MRDVSYPSSNTSARGRSSVPHQAIHPHRSTPDPLLDLQFGHLHRDNLSVKLTSTAFFLRHWKRDYHYLFE